MAPDTKAKNDHDFNSRKILAAIGKGVRVVAFPRETNSFLAGRRGRRNLLHPGRQGSTHCCIKVWQGSDPEHIERGRVFRRRWPGWTAFAHGLCNRNDGLQTSAD